MSKKLSVGLTHSEPPGPAGLVEARLCEVLGEALRLVDTALDLARPHAERWPIMPGELERAALLLAVNRGTVRRSLKPAGASDTSYHSTSHA